MPATELGTLTMLKLPGDEFVALELVHDPTPRPDRARRPQPLRGPGRGRARDRGAAGCTRDPGGRARIARRLRRLLDGMGHRPGRLPHRARPVARRASRRHDALRPGRIRGRADDRVGPAAHGTWSRSCSGANRRPTTRVLDDLVAADMVNHAAGPQGREGLRTILRTIEADLGPTSSSSTTSSARETSSSSTSRCTAPTGHPRCRCSPTCPSPVDRQRGRSSTSGGSPTGCSSSTGPVATTWACSSSSGRHDRGPDDGRRPDAPRGGGTRGRAARHDGGRVATVVSRTGSPPEASQAPSRTVHPLTPSCAPRPSPPRSTAPQ